MPEQYNCYSLSYGSIISLKSSSPAKVNRMDFSDFTIGLQGVFQTFESLH